MLSKYQEALNSLIDKSYEFANGAKVAFEIVVEVLESKDIKRLKEAKEMVKGSSKKEAKIDMKAIETLALYAPEASDLRRVVTLIKINGEFSRISDYIKAQINTLIQEIINEDLLNDDGTRVAFYKSTLKALSASVELIKTTLQDELNNLIREINLEESKCDDFVSILEKNVLMQICKESSNAEFVAKRLNSIRKLERISDRCVNIAKLSKYALEGGKLKL